MKLKTSELPVASRKPFVYRATVKSFDLRTANTSGEPYINIVLESPIGKRFDKIFLRRAWFAPDFDPKKVTDQKELGSFFSNVGASNRPGKTQRYLGVEFEGEADSPEQLSQILNERSVGKQFWVIEKQSVDKDTKIPSNNYNMYLYDEFPKKLPADAVVMSDTHEDEAAEETATPAAQ